MKKIFEKANLKKKYNSLQLKYEVLREELQKRDVELATERAIHKKRKEIWEAKLKEQEEEIIKLKRKKK